MKNEYKHIFEPFTVKRMTMKNRIVMTPMGTNYGEQNGEMSFLHINYYEQRAKGGTGLIIVENASVFFEPVVEEKLVLVVSKEHPLAEKEKISLEETEPYPQIFFTRSSGLRPTIEKMFRAVKTVPKIAYEIEEDSAMAGLAAQNFGIAVMPEVPVLKYLDIKALDITNPKIERYIYMAQIKEQYQPPVLKKFIEYVRNQQLKK